MQRFKTYLALAAAFVLGLVVSILTTGCQPPADAPPGTKIQGTKTTATRPRAKAEIMPDTPTGVASIPISATATTEPNEPAAPDEPPTKTPAKEPAAEPKEPVADTKPETKPESKPEPKPEAKPDLAASAAPPKPAVT